MSHYFMNDRNLEENRREITFRFFGLSYTLITDDGVFSKDELDYGSRLLLENVCESAIDGEILDLGCGYGPIGIVVKKCFPNANVTMVDVNERAIDLTRLNVQRYEMSNEVLVSDSFSELNNRSFNHIILNPPIRAGKQVIYSMFEQAYKHLYENGSLWIVMRKNHGAKSAISKITEIFGNYEVIDKEKGFFVIKSKKCH